MRRWGAVSIVAAMTLCPSLPSADADRPVQSFIDRMFVHIGATPESCPEELAAAGDQHVICAAHPSSFSAFKLAWESNLRRHDLAAVAHSRGPWSYSGGRYERTFEVEGQELIVRFDEKRGRIELLHGEQIARPDRPSPVPTARPRIAGFGGVSMPTVLPDGRVEPDYPPAAREAKVEGTVVLEVVVLRDGSVDSVTVLRADPTGWELEAAAIEAVRRWRFDPARDADGPVDAVHPVYVEFKIPD